MSETLKELYLEKGQKEIYFKIMEEYDCKLIDGKIYNKYNKDTKMNWNAVMVLEQAIMGFNNEEELRKQLLVSFTEELRLRGEVLK